MVSFSVVDVTDWQVDRSEPMGTKEKNWCLHPKGGSRWLFKLVRVMDEQEGLYAGEDWAEKLAAEIANDIGIPHATVELAVRDGRPGIISLDFVIDPSRLQLVHGNELMYRKFQEVYPKNQKRKVYMHTVTHVMQVLNDDFIHAPPVSGLPQGVDSAADVFVGYLLLDAVVGNVDRHHENWAIIEEFRPEESRFARLSPTFDHASSLGRELRDEARIKGLRGDKPSLSPEAYCRRARSAFYENERDPDPASPTRAFRLAAAIRPAAARAWLDRLAQCPETVFHDVVQAIPPERMSRSAREYALRLVQCNRRALLEGGQ